MRLDSHSNPTSSRTISDSYIDAADGATNRGNGKFITTRSAPADQQLAAAGSKTVVANAVATAMDTTATRHASTLGESFMFLDPRIQSGETQEQRMRDELASLQAATAGLSRGSLLPSWLQLQLLQQQQPPHQQPQQPNMHSAKKGSDGKKIRQQQELKATAAANPVDGTDRQAHRGISADQSSADSSSIAWNDQSTILTTSTATITSSNSNSKSNAGVASDSAQSSSGSIRRSSANNMPIAGAEAATAAHHNSADHRQQLRDASQFVADAELLTQSTLTYLDSQFKTNASGILNLLRTVKRLGADKNSLCCIRDICFL